MSRRLLALAAVSISLALALQFYLTHRLRQSVLAQAAAFGIELAFQHGRLGWFPPRLILENANVSFGDDDNELALETLGFSPAWSENRPAKLVAVSALTDFSEQQNRVPLQISALLWSDRLHSTLRLAPVTATLANLTLSGNITLRKAAGQLEYHGELNAPAFDPRTTLAALGLNAEVADPDALRSASLKARLQGDRFSLNLHQLSATLDQTHVTGSIVVYGFHPPQTRMDLRLDSIDMNRYQPLQTFPENMDDYAPKESPFQLFAALVSALHAHGKLTAGKLKLTDAQYSDQPLTIGAP